MTDRRSSVLIVDDEFLIQELLTLLVEQMGLTVCGTAATAEEAERFIKGDPFFANGIFLRYQLRPWNPVLGNRELFPA